MYDVPKEQYVTVIREMIRHENDLTNHRTMWLLIVQGLLANAYVAARGGLGRPVILMLSLVGIFVNLSAFVMLYKSYQARGYLHFLGRKLTRVDCRRNTSHSMAGRKTESKAGGETSRSVHGLRKLLMRSNRGYSCRALSCPCGCLFCWSRGSCCTQR
jgi:hypothetical protein